MVSLYHKGVQGALDVQWTSVKCGPERSGEFPLTRGIVIHNAYLAKPLGSQWFRGLMAGGSGKKKQVKGGVMKVEEDLILLTKPEELLLWLRLSESEISLTRRDARILTSYMEGHDYALAVRGNELVRKDVAEEQGEVVPYTLDEASDQVCEWNYELIEIAEKGMAESENFEDFTNHKNAYDALKEDEPYLDRMYMHTSFGRNTIEVVKKMVQEVAGDKLGELVENGIRAEITDDMASYAVSETDIEKTERWGRGR